MLKAVVISNDIFGLDKMFCGNDLVAYRFVPVSGDFKLDLSDADLLIIPNGCDHIAMLKVKETVNDFLQNGGALFCFDGWFTNWIPGNQWIHNNNKATRDIRYSIKDDRHGLFDGVNLDDLQFNHGISGWWACGAIEEAEGADVLLVDTWNRSIIVVDEATTPGLMILTASGPLADRSFENEENGLSALYQNMLRLVHNQKEHAHAIA